jgi:flavin reductase (DIM6/NTAB) family NADH-FMN oxidoreductase RutF
MTVSAFSSVSLSPPLVLICIEHTADMHAVLQGATHFAVNVLAEDQEPISRRFAEEMDNRFDGLGFTRGASGLAILDGVLAFAECEIAARHSEGDHTIVIGHVLGGEARHGRPLLYYRGGYTQLEP